MKFKIISKTKNEYILIEPWIQYHTKLVGYENIVIFDNNSTDERVLEVYRKYPIEIHQISYPDSIHFYESHQIFYDTIFNNYDWFTIIDTDEFLCGYENEILSPTKALDIIGSFDNTNVLVASWLKSLFYDINNIDYFMANSDELIKLNSKGIYGTLFKRLKETVYGHGLLCKNQEGVIDAKFNTGLILLHLANINPDARQKNNISFLLQTTKLPHANTEICILRQIIHDELLALNNTGKPTDTLLYTDFSRAELDSWHKLVELQLYYRDRQTFIDKLSVSREYIKSNIINSYINDIDYHQEIVTEQPKTLKDILIF